MTDVSIVQKPRFGDGTPDGGAGLLAGYGASRLMLDGAVSSTFHGGGELLLALAWAAALGVASLVVLRRAVGTRG